MRDGVRIPPSLRNVFKELAEDVGRRAAGRRRPDRLGAAGRAAAQRGADRPGRRGRLARRQGLGGVHRRDDPGARTPATSGWSSCSGVATRGRRPRWSPTRRTSVLEAGHPSPLNPKGFRGVAAVQRGQQGPGRRRPPAGRLGSAVAARVGTCSYSLWTPPPRRRRPRWSRSPPTACAGWPSGAPSTPARTARSWRPQIAAVLADAGVRPRRPGRDRGRARDRARSPGCGSGWPPPRAWAQALGIPTYGVCSLDALGRAAGPGRVLVATDARRREVYYATYRTVYASPGPSVAPSRPTCRRDRATTGWSARAP